MSFFSWPPISVTASSGPVEFVKDAVPTQVSEDTANPSNNEPLPTKTFGHQKVNNIVNVYSTTNVGTGAYVQILASTAGRSDFMTLFDGGGYAMILAFGGAGVEVDQLYIPPGGFNGVIPFYIPAGTRLSLKCLEAGITVSLGIFVMNTLE